MKINAYNDKDLIYISLGNLDCSIENTLKILEKFKSNVVIMQIGDVKKEGELFEIIKRVSRKYWLVCKRRITPRIPCSPQLCHN